MVQLKKQSLELELSELEKFIYNKHLAISRSQKSKPFKFKKNFQDLDHTKRLFLKRIATLLKKHKTINIDVFFSAPYKLYPDVEFFGLDYFASMRAIKAYTMYKQILFLGDPDSQINEIKQSLEYIVKFCIKKKIQLYKYPKHKTADLYTWMIHYKENNINPYVMMEFKNVYSSLLELGEDIRHFYVSDFIEQYKSLYLKYSSSTTVKSYLQKTLPVLQAFVEKQLTQQ
jgi:hypothetical protein